MAPSPTWLKQRALDAALLSYQGAGDDKALQDAAALDLGNLITRPADLTYVNERIVQLNIAPAVTPTQGATPTQDTPAPTTTPTPTPTPTTQDDPTTVVSIAPSDTGLTVPELLKKYLESDPRLMLGAALNSFNAAGASQNFNNWFERNFDSFWTRYLGTLAAQAVQGQIPNVSFVDYVKRLDTTGQFFGATARDSNRQSQVFSDYVNSSQAAG